MIKVRDERDQVNIAKVYRASQEHIFRYWDELSPDDRRTLLNQIAGFDFQLLGRLVNQVAGRGTSDAIRIHRFEPIPDPLPLPTTDAERERVRAATEAGEEAVRSGRVAALLVAGGLGTRLGFPGPKGCFPIGPVTGKTLLQLFAEKIQALDRRYRVSIPWYILTSESNRDDTIAFFQQHAYFGLGRVDIFFLTQRELPVVDQRGKLILAEKGRIATSPNGHGGVVPALRESGALDDMARRGCDLVYYFQVDNPLAKVADPAFLGALLLAEQAEVAGKYVRKTDPAERVGVFGLVDGRAGVIEYTELPKDEAERRRPDGSLAFDAGSIAIHAFRRPFLERLTSPDRGANGGACAGLPYHQALKRVPFVNRRGEKVVPDEPNGVKFECFVFDTFKEATGTVVVETDRAEEFAPVKNEDGKDSPRTAKQAMSDLYGGWLDRAGAKVPRDPATGHVTVPIEVSPLYALDEEELARKAPDRLVVSGPLKL